MRDLRDEANTFELNAGDMLIDDMLGTIGIVMCHEDDEQIAGYYYKSKFWKVFWISVNEDCNGLRGPTYVEEYGLKMSIVIGIYKLYKPTHITKDKKI